MGQSLVIEDVWVMDDRDDSPERGEWNPDPDEATGRRFFNEVEGWEGWQVLFTWKVDVRNC